MKTLDRRPSGNPARGKGTPRLTDVNYFCRGRSAQDTTNLRALGWTPRQAFSDGLAATVEWYRENPWWWQPIKHKDSAYQAYYEAQYQNRDGAR